MQINVNPGPGIQTSEALEAHVHARLEGIGRRLGDHITRIEVYLKDTNAGKGGVDIACTMEARPAGLDPVAVEAQAEDAYTAITEASRKLEAAATRRIERSQNRAG